MRRNLTKAELDKRRILWRRTVLIVTVLGILYLIVPLLLGDMGILKYFEMLRTRHQVQASIEKLNADNQTLRENIDALRSDPNRIEKLAREQLGLVKSGEVVYQFRAQPE
jgi:cell division protein FtsB